MQKPATVLDLNAPMLSLRICAGFGNPHAAAEARGVAYAAQRKAEQQGAATKLATLIKAAETFGYEIEITATPKRRGPAKRAPGRSR